MKPQVNPAGFNEPLMDNVALFERKLHLGGEFNLPPKQNQNLEVVNDK
mgnify:CR=1 FL=1